MNRFKNTWHVMKTESVIRRGKIKPSKNCVGMAVSLLGNKHIYKDTSLGTEDKLQMDGKFTFYASCVRTGK